MTITTTIEFTAICPDVDPDRITEEKTREYAKRIKNALCEMCNADDINVTSVKVFPTEDV